MAIAWRDRELLSLVLVIIASVLEKADSAALPAVFRELGVALQVSPSALGIFKLVQLLSQAACSPFAGYLALRYKRTTVIAAGALVSTIATFSIGISTTFAQIASAIALNSLGVAVTWPAIQSLVADSTEESNRGKTFGCLQLTSHVGTFFGGVLAVLLAGTSGLGVSGWRVAFFIMSALSLLISIAVHLFADDPAPSVMEGGAKVRRGNLKDMLLDSKSVMGVKTFQILVGQGCIASLAFSALSFSPMWLELMGFSHPQTATILGFFLVAGSLGGLFGGWMGDRMSIWLPDSGRIVMAQVSIGLAIPLTTILLLIIPQDPATPLLHGTVFFVMGLCISWPGPATIFPIMAEIVPQHSRTNIYALEKTFVSILSAFSPPLVGAMSEKFFGFAPVPKAAGGDLRVSIDRQNASALAKALYACMGLPLLLCCLVYSLLYWAYPKDRDSVRFQLPQQSGGVRLRAVEEQQRFSLVEQEEEDKDNFAHSRRKPPRSAESPPPRTLITIMKRLTSTLRGSFSSYIG